MTNSHQSRRTTSATGGGGQGAEGLRQTFEMTFPADAGRVQQVRRVVSAYLRYWRRVPLADAVLLATDEAFANAVTHGSRSPKDQVCVAMENSSEQLRVAISDVAPGLPIIPPDPDPLAESGRGLALIDSITDGWGVEPADEGLGKTVWFVFKTPAEAAVPGSEAVALCSSRTATTESPPSPLLSYPEGRQGS